MEHQRPWNNLCSELLSIIISKCSATAAATAYFGTVCADWRRSLTKYSPIPPIRSPQPPFLLLPSRTIRIPSLGKVVRLPFKDPSIKNYSSDPKLIELPQLEEAIGCICIGSSHGWLITLSQDSSVSLFNPVTQETIHLHPLSSINDEILSFKRYPVPEYHLVGKKIRDSQFSIVRFAVLSSDPAHDSCFTLLLFLSGLKTHCFMSQGRGGKWNLHVHQLFEREVEDVVFINGVFVTIDRFFELKIFDFNNHETGLVVKKVQLSQILKKPIGNIFLVNSDGHLLVVYTRRPFTGTMQSSILRGNISVFDFHKCPLNGVNVEGKKINKLKGVVLFLGHGCSVAVAVEHFPWLKEDVVYFTRDYTKLEREHRGGERMAASNQRTISICQNNIRDKSRSKSNKVLDDVGRSRYAIPEYWSFPRPFWVTPNLRLPDFFILFKFKHRDMDSADQSLTKCMLKSYLMSVLLRALVEFLTGSNQE
ncbi:uncharacterized protein LOC144551867 [Carex rostrata]